MARLNERTPGAGERGGEFATAPFLHTADDLGLKVVARLKCNLPELLHAAEACFAHRRPRGVFQNSTDRIEIRDADDFDPWDALRGKQSV